MLELLTSLVMAKPLHIMTWNCYRHQMDNYRKLYLYSSFHALLEYNNKYETSMPENINNVFC